MVKVNAFVSDFFSTHLLLSSVFSIYHPTLGVCKSRERSVCEKLTKFEKLELKVK